jgi:hypothetical protein
MLVICNEVLLVIFLHFSNISIPINSITLYHYKSRFINNQNLETLTTVITNSPTQLTTGVITNSPTHVPTSDVNRPSTQTPPSRGMNTIYNSHRNKLNTNKSVASYKTF